MLGNATHHYKRGGIWFQPNKRGAERLRPDSPLEEGGLSSVVDSIAFQRRLDFDEPPFQQCNAFFDFRQYVNRRQKLKVDLCSLRPSLVMWEAVPRGKVQAACRSLALV
jgi:hypothetical protein